MIEKKTPDKNAVAIPEKVPRNRNGIPKVNTKSHIS